MQYHIALLALGLQVRKTLPVDQVLGTGDSSCSSGSAEVARLAIVVTLRTENAVDVTILVGGQAHIIDIGSRHDILRHSDRLIPETEVVDTVRTLSHSEETLAVGSFHTYHEQILAIPLDGTRVERSIHHDALHQVWITLLIEVVTPLQRSMLCCQNRVLVLLVDAVAPLYRFVLAAQQLLMMSTQCLYFVLKRCHILIILL